MATPCHQSKPDAVQSWRRPASFASAPTWPRDAPLFLPILCFEALQKTFHRRTRDAVHHKGISREIAEPASRKRRLRFDVQTVAHHRHPRSRGNNRRASTRKIARPRMRAGTFNRHPKRYSGGRPGIAVYPASSATGLRTTRPSPTFSCVTADTELFPRCDLSFRFTFV